MRAEIDLRSSQAGVRLAAASMAAAQFLVDGSSVESLERFIDDLDRHTFFAHGHSTNVARYVADLHRAFGAAPESVARRYYAGLLHDIGKVGVPMEILGKPGALTDHEYDVIKAHPAMGAEVVCAVPHLEDLAAEIRHHHERIDGNGYPDRLSGDEIPFSARVLAVADAFDAMTSDRVYREAFPRERAIAELELSAGTQLDGHVVEAFIATLV